MGNNYVEYDESLQPVYSGEISLADSVALAQQGMENTGQLIASLDHMYTMRQRTKQIKEISKVQMANTVARYKLCREFLESTFAERHEALSKYYDVLDKAVESGDNQLIIAAMGNISDVVSTSPLADLQHMAEIFNDTSVPLLDF